MFIDKAKIVLKSGRGGNGSISFCKEKNGMGGPNGGDGGRGGNIYIQGNPNINTLFKFKYKSYWKAHDGQSGTRKNKHGRNGADLIIDVPIGTHISFNNQSLCLLSEEKKMILRGGKGGIGNGKLATSVNKAPDFSIPPTEGMEVEAFLELKLLGDIGLVGLPNAGKSSLMNKCTNALSKIGHYAFTTLQPKLGVIKYIKKSLTIVDLPGIMEKASEGKGLGLQFLSHIERCKFILHIIDINNNPKESFSIIQKELNNYGIFKPQVIILNKIDTMKKKEQLKIKQFFIEQETKVFLISTLYNAGIKTLLRYLDNENY